MAHYIGNEPANGEFKHLDSIASQFNGGSVQVTGFIRITYHACDITRVTN